MNEQGRFTRWRARHLRAAGLDPDKTDLIKTGLLNDEPCPECGSRDTIDLIAFEDHVDVAQCLSCRCVWNPA